MSNQWRIDEHVEKYKHFCQDDGWKQVEALEILTSPEQQKPKRTEDIFPKELQNDKIKNKSNEIKTTEERIDRKDLIYKTNKHIFNLQQFLTISSIFSCKIMLGKADKKPSNLSENILEFHNKTKSRSKADKPRKKTFRSITALYQG